MFSNFSLIMFSMYKLECRKQILIHLFLISFLLFAYISSTYIVGVDAFCIGKNCLKQTSLHALVDSGTSFTFLPDDVYEKVVQEVLFSTMFF